MVPTYTKTAVSFLKLYTKIVLHQLMVCLICLFYVQEVNGKTRIISCPMLCCGYCEYIWTISNIDKKIYRPIFYTLKSIQYNHNIGWDNAIHSSIDSTFFYDNF